MYSFGFTDATHLKAKATSNFDRALSGLLAEHHRVVDELIEEVLQLKEQLYSGPPVSQHSECPLQIPKQVHGAHFTPLPSEMSSQCVSVSKIRSHKCTTTSMSLPEDVGSPPPTREAQSYDLFPALHVHAAQKAAISESTKRKSNLHRFVHHNNFELVVFGAIFINTICMCLEGQYAGYSIGHSLNVEGYENTSEETWPGLAEFLLYSDRVCLIIFTIELVLRLSVFGLSFFLDFLNGVDCVVVIFGILTWIGADVFNPRMMRLLRIVRLARLVRGLSKRQFVDALHFLLISIRASMSTLFWALCVLVIIQCLAALCMSQLIESWLTTALESPESTKVFRYFGTFTRSLFSMFEVLIGNWAVPCRVLTDNVGEWYGSIMLAYRCICGFSIINVISAVFIQQTMKTMSQDTDIMLLERVRMETRFKANLEVLFHAIDIDHDGVITKEEMTNEMMDPAVRLKCFRLGIDVHDLEDIFNLFCGGVGEGMKVTDFIHAAHSVRKQSNTLDIARLLMHSRKLQAQVYEMRTHMKSILQAIKVRSP